jgi:hypothetical protein
MAIHGGITVRASTLFSAGLISRRACWGVFSLPLFSQQIANIFAVPAGGPGGGYYQ